MTSSSLASLLGRLDADPERAGSAYEHLHRALVGFFTWRGNLTPEECADETLDRLAARLQEGLVVQDLVRFARGIARHVLLEQWRRPEARALPLNAAGTGLRAADAQGDEGPLERLDQCLQELPADGRTLILAYYGHEGRARIESRKRLARSLGISATALRNRAQRLRDELQRLLARGTAAPSAQPQPSQDRQLQ